MRNLNRFRERLTKLKQLSYSSRVYAKLFFIATGIVSTIWFLIRVIPKPQRATYPCMRAAAPVMSGFIIYLLSLGGLTLLFKRTYSKIKQAKFKAAIFSFILFLVVLAGYNIYDSRMLNANPMAPAPVNPVTWDSTLPDAPNMPVGNARGIFPGRVAWVWNIKATNPNCTQLITDAFFMPKNYVQDTINKMTDKAIKFIGGKSSVADSWDAIFKHFNKEKTGTESGYTAGQKIFIKVNNGQAGWSINTDMSAKGQTSYMTGTTGIAISETSPACVVAVIRQLVDSCGVAQENIMVGEPMTHVYKHMYDAIHSVYPNVKVMDKDDKTAYGRTKSTGWQTCITWSDKGKVMTSAITDDLMNEMYNADYLINIAPLKAHARSGITLTAKNHFGSSSHNKSYGASALHSGSINVSAMSGKGVVNGGNDNLTNCRGSYHMYRVLTDIMMHQKIGRNTVLYIVDGLWSGIEATDMPVKWKTFNNNWPNSIFASEDEVAIQSVCLDFLRAEAKVNTLFNNRPFFPAVDDFLHQAATNANWPDSILGIDGKWYSFAGYDPEADGANITSMGIHEHWNNGTAKEYSRNLYSNGTGIELVSYPDTLVKKGNISAKSIELTITDSTGPLANTRVVVNGSNYLTDAQGKVTVGNLKENSLVKFSANKKDYLDQSSQVTLSGETTQVNMQMHSKLKTSNPGDAISQKNLNVTFSAYPNPATESTTILYSLKSTSKVNLYLISMDGKIVKQFRNETLAAGKYQDKVMITGLNSGSYICVLKNGNEISTFKLMIK